MMWWEMDSKCTSYATDHLKPSYQVSQLVKGVLMVESRCTVHTLLYSKNMDTCLVTQLLAHTFAIIYEVWECCVLL